MTLTEFQTIIHKLYQGDDDTPSSNDEEFTVRTGYLEMSINVWNGEKGVMWRELWTTATGVTIADDIISLAALTDFRFPGGFLRIKEDGVNWSYIPIVDQPKSELFKNGANPDKIAWVTGNKRDGFSVNLSWTPSAGLDYQLPYYKDPFIPSSPSHVIEMSDPYFAVYLTLAKLHEQDGEGDRASLALTMADSRLSAMKTLNSKMPSYQENYVPDRDLEIGVGGFGE